jgi:putative transcriptional regulator
LPAKRARPMVAAVVDKPAFLSGKLLLAMPGMADPRFERAVIALCVHDENGAVGIGVGHKRAGISFRGLLRQLDIEPGEAPECAVLHGGPVEPGRGFVLHSADWGGQDTLHVNGDHGELFAMTGTIDVLRAIAEGRGPKRWIAALGYAGWGEGQLDEEMTRHGWFAARADTGILFDTPADERWAAAFKAEGIDPRLLGSETGVA